MSTMEREEAEEEWPGVLGDKGRQEPRVALSFCTPLGISVRDGS